MKNLFALIILFISLPNFAQVKGKVTDENGYPLAAVSIHLENTYIGTTTNETGEYFLDIKKQGTFVIVFQYLGFKSQKIKSEFDNTIKTLDVTLISLKVLIDFWVGFAGNCAEQKKGIKNNKHMFTSVNPAVLQ